MLIVQVVVVGSGVGVGFSFLLGSRMETWSWHVPALIFAVSPGDGSHTKGNKRARMI